MSDASAGSDPLPRWRGGWLKRLVANPGFQSWAARFPLTRRQARKDGAALFDIVQGFVQSQVLLALVELNLPRRLRGGPLSPEQLGHACDVPADRMQSLCQAGVALGLFRRCRGGRYALARKGAALMGVPGLEAMIRHHRAFYDDLRDPVALLRGPETTELSRFWPYVFGAAQADDPQIAATYSNLMADSQRLVAQDTLDTVSLKGVTQLMDIGGGTGAFLAAAGQRYPRLQMILFDLPAVVATAGSRLEQAGVADRVAIVPGSFRDDPLPRGADAISLVRVLYDHQDETVEALLSAVFDALSPGGRLILSEPMGGGRVPDRAGDVYFAFYTMAMQTGRTRSPAEIRDLCESAGFTGFACPPARRSYVTRVLTAVKPE